MIALAVAHGGGVNSLFSCCFVARTRSSSVCNKHVDRLTDVTSSSMISRRPPAAASAKVSRTTSISSQRCRSSPDIFSGPIRGENVGVRSKCWENETKMTLTGWRVRWGCSHSQSMTCRGNVISKYWFGYFGSKHENTPNSS